MSETPNLYGTNSGHGHAWPRPDGVKMRCGGVKMCPVCAKDFASLTVTQAAPPRLQPVSEDIEWLRAYAKIDQAHHWPKTPDVLNWIAEHNARVDRALATPVSPPVLEEAIARLRDAIHQSDNVTRWDGSIPAEGRQRMVLIEDLRAILALSHGGRTGG